ncbi:MAG: Flp family type IVb pilin [Solirubrobacterales bacterium]
MRPYWQWFRRRIADERGAPAIEYVILVASIAAVAIAAVAVVGARILDWAGRIP